jgi:subtilisin family serine protease
MGLGLRKPLPPAIRAGRILAAVLLILAMGPGSAAWGASMVGDGAAAPYLVLFTDSTDVDGKLRGYARTHKVRADHAYRHGVQGFAARLDARQLATLSSDPAIALIEPDRRVELTAQALPTGVDRVDAELSPTANIDGLDNRVDADIAIIDTGIQPDHPDLNVAGGYNCVPTEPDWNDGYPHGTHVAGIAAALDNGVGVVGVAPGARVWGVRVFDRTGYSRLSWIVCGIDWVASQRDPVDPSKPLFEAANMSLRDAGRDDGNCGETNGDAEHRAICAAVAAGVTFAVSSGNDRTDSSRWIPAAYPEVITVSALADLNGSPGGGGARSCLSFGSYDVDDTFADFSNFGPAVDLIAPGKCIRSTYPTTKDASGYRTLSGTSMASPHVAGAIALYKVLFPHATPAQVQAGLRAAGTQNWLTSSDPDGNPEPLLDVSNLAAHPPGPTPTPTPSPTPGPTTPGSTATPPPTPAPGPTATPPPTKGSAATYAAATYAAVTPNRILDSRVGNGLSGRFQTGLPRTFQVTDRQPGSPSLNVPADAIAVTGNLTVTDQTHAGWLTVTPSPAPNPATSSLNFPVKDSRASGVTVPLGPGGTLAIVLNGGPASATANAVFDVSGYFLPGTSGATYEAVGPSRLLDTRNGTGLSGAFESNAPRTFQVTDRLPGEVGRNIPSGAVAVTGNLTVTGQTHAGWLTATPSPQRFPATSTLNFPTGDSRANGLTVPLGSGGTMAIVYNGASASATAHAIFDATGYFLPGDAGARYVPLVPNRLLDSRFGNGLVGPFEMGVPRSFEVADRVAGDAARNVPRDAVAVTATLTVTGQTHAGWLTLTPGPEANPPTSTINFPVGDSRANGVAIALDSGRLALVYGGGTSDTAHAVLDVTGYFAR